MNLVKQEKINILSTIVQERIPELLEKLEINGLRKAGKMLVGPCPIHGGNRPDAFNFYPEGHTIKGIWYCRSKNCHEVFGKNIIGLTWAMLSVQKGYDGSSNTRKCLFDEVIDFLCKFVGQKFSSIKVNLAEIEKQRYIQEIEKASRSPFVEKNGWSRSQVRAKLSVPAHYFLNQGYSSSILETYDIGNPLSGQESPMHNRVVVPIYDAEYKVAVGFTGRSIFPKCLKCSQYHDGTCPAPHVDFSKWRNSKGFIREQYLYNFWFSKDKIRDSKTIILVEGPGDIWKLEEAGIHNGVAIFGTNLTDRQQILVEKSGAMNVLLMLDNDGAGHEAASKIQRQLNRFFNVKIVSEEFFSGYKDVGSMPSSLIKENFLCLS